MVKELNERILIPMKQATFEFDNEAPKLSAKAASKPAGYKGLYAFHKYWGKKPHEILGFLIETLSQPKGIVVDPFVGSGVCGREAIIRDRKFVGVDISPLAIQLATLLVDPPDYRELKSAMKTIERECKETIMSTYSLEDGGIATHYLWDETELQQVWTRPPTGRARVERDVTEHDIQLIDSFNSSEQLRARPPRFFTNSRINAKPDMSWDDLFTRRAQTNVRALTQAIANCSDAVRPAMELCLTAASGQMTKMVFAVSGRGKKTGKSSSRVEVGSWVIGYWRPKVHFEVNVWNCFERRVNKLLRASRTIDDDRASVSNSIADIAAGQSECALVNGDALQEMKKLPSESVELIITDPPHSDRVPYLELSEFWNSLLDKQVDFDSEIVISNAKERQKSEGQYVDSMQSLFAETARVLKPSGFLVVLFNSVNATDWEIFRKVCDPSNQLLKLLGSFLCKYSAGSVVQDNRNGALENDVGIVFARFNSESDSQLKLLSQLPGWSAEDLSHLVAKGN